MKPPNQSAGLETWPDEMQAREALTQAVQEQICKAVRLGAHDRFAARYAGVPPRWLRRWMKMGKQARVPYDNDYQRHCAALYAAVEKNRGHYVFNTLCKIEHVGGTQWQALAWKLKQFLTGYQFMKTKNQHQKNKVKKNSRQEKRHDEKE